MFLFSSDWHLTSRPKDEYRWGIFPWLKRQSQLRGVTAIFILGDIADSKNHHPNEFINKLVDSLRDLGNACPVYMLAGNHDYTNPDEPLLRFMNQPPVHFYSKPTSIEVDGYKVLMVPNQKTANSVTLTLNQYKATEHSFVLMHQTFKGSVGSNGMALDGLEPIKAKSKTVYISGDVHVPQVIGDVTYCGSPHPVHFGDIFKPRVLFWDGKELKSIPRTTIKKEVVEIESLAGLDERSDLTEGDQIKVILRLPRTRFGEWETIRDNLEIEARKKGLILSSMELQESNARPRIVGAPPKRTASPKELLKAFCVQNAVDKDFLDFGVQVLNDSLS